MAHVFRLYKGNDTILDWGDSIAYGSNQIKDIEDANGAKISQEITSIPSPFARIDLVKTAFREVVDSNSLTGNTVYHKMVSDTLDIAELFFNFDKLRTKLEIIVWDKANELTALQQGSSGQQIVGDTLNKFLTQDAVSYNFKQMQRIYLLNYVGPYRKSSMDIIGATSPASLFFSSANDLSYISNDIQFGEHKVFDRTHLATLAQRDPHFIRYIYAFRTAYISFATHFPEVYDYLEKTLALLPNELKNDIAQLTPQAYFNYPELQIPNTANQVDINGELLRMALPISIHSDFEIRSSCYPGELKPLVLPVEAGNRYQSLHYVQAPWGTTNKAPFQEQVPLEQRTLPFDGATYPYLTISDFLEDTIIRIPEQGNDQAFFNAAYDVKESTYLLPLKERFFEFFTIEELMDKRYPMLKLTPNAGGVKATLRIPIQKGQFVEYTRLYFEDNIADVQQNKGGIVEKDFLFALYSNIRYQQSREAYYRIALMSRFENNSEYSINCFHERKLVHMATSDPIIRNSDNDSYRKCQTYTVEKSHVDYCRVHCAEGVSGVILPKWISQSGSDQYTFAIDFGTTNTHVEYQVNNQPPRTFSISKDDKQIQRFTQCDDIFLNTLYYDFIPEEIGDEYYFPTRTVLCEAKNINWNQHVFAMAHANIPFPYDKNNKYKYNQEQTNLKWSNDSANSDRVYCYIESLFLLLRHKVARNGGILASTKIVWFYPISMTQGRFNQYASLWEKAYQKYFGNSTGNLIPMTESVAPYEFYKANQINTHNMVTIDIGGGTSDIVLATNGKVQAITSFRLAADSLFGDAFVSGRNQPLNGIVSQFIDNIRNILKANKIDVLANILEEHVHNNISSDLASFFFSLKENKEIKKKNISDKIDFNQMLQRDDSQKIVFLFFYVALIYHLATIMKAKVMSMPRHIAFSGNGSKVIRILSTSNETLERLTKLIFSKIYGLPYPADGLTVLQNTENPKEVTCKGGITSPQAQSYEQMADTKIVLLGIDRETFVDNTLRYQSVDNATILQVIEQVQSFIQFVFELDQDFSFKKELNISEQSLQVARMVCTQDLEVYIHKGLETKLQEASPEDIIEETLFFYPLTGMLHALGQAIYEQQKDRQS